MNITVQLDLDKMEIENFSDLEQSIYMFGLNVSREIMEEILKQRDLQLLAERDADRYRCKGSQKTSIKTKFGVVEYERRVYLDNAAVEGKRYVHLLDTDLGIDPIGQVSPGVCELISKSICESSYDSTSRQVRDMTGLFISKQGTWNIVQKLGERQRNLVCRHAELAEAGQGLGALSTSILYEENDGVWLHLQGKSRRQFGESKEMKVGIAYDGSLCHTTKNGKRRYSLDNKVAYAGFLSSKKFKKQKEGIVASRFNADDIELRVINGDGAQWIQKHKGVNCICVLDEYHRNRKLTECVKDKEFADLLRNLLHENRFADLLDCVEAQINSINDEDEIEKLKELYRYYKSNFKALPSYYDRGIEIPETRIPGEILHSRLGSMESNIFTLISNRMKHGRRCWSINGANNLAAILCAYHTTGFEGMFGQLPEPPVIQGIEEWTNDVELTLSGSIPLTEGRGTKAEHSFNESSTYDWINAIMSCKPFDDINFKY